VVEPSKSDDVKLIRRKRRALALALVLGALVLIFYILTIVKMGPAVLDRPL
jgi:hypothetical protein